MKNSSDTISFESFGFNESIQKAISKVGFTQPTLIQGQVIPHILSGADIVAQAQTGSGKTAAFGLPSLHLLDSHPDHTGLLVITPTRELAVQVSEELARYGANSGIRTVAVYGGSSVSRQIDAIQRGANVVVATPGRLLDLLESGRMKKFKPSIVVLDEADEMLDMGFLEDIEAIFKFLPEQRQTLLFSATMPKPIQNLAREILKDPVFVTVGSTGFSHQDIEHAFYAVSERDRDTAFFRILATVSPAKAIIFCRTKKDVDTLCSTLVSHGLPAKSLHGDMQQSQRQQVTNAFRDGGIKYLIATDVAARGLNISDVTHIFNYHIPFEGEDYVHRAGRTGRAGKKGTAITLGTVAELKKLQRLLNCKSTSEIQIRPIPSVQDIRQFQVQRLVERVEKQSIRDEAYRILDSLKERVDGDKLSLALVSLLISQKDILGSEELLKPSISIETPSMHFGREDGDRRNSRSRPGQRAGKPWKKGSFSSQSKFKKSSRPFHKN